MGAIIRAADTIYSFRFLRLLTTPWRKMGAYKAGLIDDKGNLIRRPENAFESSKLTLLHKIVFNLKKILNKIPFGKSTIASYAAALYLIKEHTALTDAQIAITLHEITGLYPDPSLILKESPQYIKSGTYKLLNDIALPKTGDLLALKNSEVIIENNVKSIGSIFGISVYPAHHIKTRQNICVTIHDLNQVNV